MSSGSSDMAGCVLGTAFSLLLLASIIQGHRDVDVFYKEKIEAVVGQDVVLPCIVENRTDLHVVSIEWSKNKDQNTKLAVYSSRYGHHKFQENVTIQIANNTKGSYLNLSGVTEWDSGIYVCDLTTFPLGTIRRETVLEIKDVTCDVDGTVEVNAGENVTIECSAFSDAQYRWTKNGVLVSESESLKLSRVTDARTGVYTLTVNSGNKRLHKEFIVTVLAATTTTRTGLATVSPRSNISEDGLTESASSLTTSPTTVLTTTDTNVTWTISMSSDGTPSDATDDNSNMSNVTLTSYTNNAQTSLTSTPATHTDLYYSGNTADQDINAPHTSETSTFSDQSANSSLSTALSYGSTDSVSESTQETWTYTSTLPTTQPEINSSTSPEESDTRGSVTENSDTGATTTLRNEVVIEDEGPDGAQSELLLVLIIVPALVLIAVAGYIYRKQVIKQRMDLPPPFKPPPPPVKYTSATHSEISTQPFPTSRCNSLAQVRDMRLYEYTA